jgi:hypothetical protein
MSSRREDDSCVVVIALFMLVGALAGYGLDGTGQGTALGAAIGGGGCLLLYMM